MQFGGLTLVIVACVGVAEVVSAKQQRERDAAVHAWIVRSETATDVKLPVLMHRFAEVPFSSYIQRTAGSPTRLPGKFAAAFGPWHADRSPRSTSVGLVSALRRAGFTNVVMIAHDDGWKVTGSTSAGDVWVYVHPRNRGSSLVGSLNPAIPRCC
jgi:hypothetical protein